MSVNKGLPKLIERVALMSLMFIVVRKIRLKFSSRAQLTGYLIGRIHEYVTIPKNKHNAEV